MALKERYWCHVSKGNKATSKLIPQELSPYQIKLLEECSEEQQVTREQYWYDTLTPLYNRYRPGQTQKEYDQTEARKEKKREARNRHYANHRDDINAKRRQPTDTASCAEQT
jgi:hypothetical protein